MPDITDSFLPEMDASEQEQYLAAEPISSGKEKESFSAKVKDFVFQMENGPEKEADDVLFDSLLGDDAPVLEPEIPSRPRVLNKEEVDALLAEAEKGDKDKENERKVKDAEKIREQSETKEKTNLWQKIKNAFKKAFEHIKNFFDDITTPSLLELRMAGGKELVNKVYDVGLADQARQIETDRVRMENANRDLATEVERLRAQLSQQKDNSVPAPDNEKAKEILTETAQTVQQQLNSLEKTRDELRAVEPSDPEAEAKKQALTEKAAGIYAAMTVTIEGYRENVSELEFNNTEELLPQFTDIRLASEEADKIMDELDIKEEELEEEIKDEGPSIREKIEKMNIKEEKAVDVLMEELSGKGKEEFEDPTKDISTSKDEASIDDLL